MKNLTSKICFMTILPLMALVACDPKPDRSSADPSTPQSESSPANPTAGSSAPTGSIGDIQNLLETYRADETVIGNGGDVAYCKNSETNKFTDFYAVDFLVTYDSANPMTEATDWKASQVRILKQLKRLNTQLHESFKNYLKDLDKKPSENSKRLWQPSSFGLSTLSDEALIGNLPENCKHEDSNGKTRLLQTVIRSIPKADELSVSTKVSIDPADPAAPAMVKYDYNKSMMEWLKSQRPVQYSFMIVHEWLWDFTKDINSVRTLNALIHSEELENISADDFIQKFIGLSFRLHSQLKIGSFEDKQKCEININKDPEDKAQFFIDWKNCSKESGLLQALGEDRPNGSGIWFKCDWNNNIEICQDDKKKILIRSKTSSEFSLSKNTESQSARKTETESADTESEAIFRFKAD
jgi:hypothetical protein